MALFEFQKDGLTEIATDTMSNLRIRERQDLQDVLRTHFKAIDPEVLVISEEYSGWQDSRRRIDLLGIDRKGSLVVIELKRTTDGGHMDLQAIRYAAMVSAIRFTEVVEVFDQFLRKHGRQDSARDLILDHVEGDANAVEAVVGEQVRMVLVSQDFDTEITTAVLWLNEQGLDIRCVRLQPYLLGERVIFDIQQIIPLREAAEYLVKQRGKVADQKAAIQREARDFTKFRVIVNGTVQEHLPKNRAILAVVKALHARGVSPLAMAETIKQGGRRFYRVPGIVGSEDEFIKAAGEASAHNEDRVFDPRRYFTSMADLLTHGGDTYAFSNQWGQWTANKMNDLIKAHGEGTIQVAAEPSQ